MGVCMKTQCDKVLSRETGFSLIELMIAVAIIGIAAAKAIASEITRHLVVVRTRAMTTNQTLNVQIVLVNGNIQMTTTNLAGTSALQGLNGITARHMSPLVFNNGGIPNGGVVQFNSYGIRTSVPGTGVQTIQVGGTLGGTPTTQYRINIAPSGTSGLVRL